MRSITTTCCVVGGGPAGMMLGLLLARSGIATVVLEKHADFLRDFRGDTVQPSTMELLAELDLLDAFLELPHQRMARIQLEVGGRRFRGPDLSRLPVRCGFIAFVPQWDFLDFLAGAARRYPDFDLRMSVEATDIVEDDRGVVRGVRASTPTGLLEVRADLVIGADGRHSTIRERAGLPTREFGVPIDVLWFRLPRPADGPSEPALGRIHDGRLMVTIDRGDYYQCGFVIARGGNETLRRGGLDAFRAQIVALAPFLADVASELRDWNQVKLLTVRIDRLERWHRPGLVCIGDAAHAMSPAGGVGINLAIQDAVAAANAIVPPLRAGDLRTGHLARIERRRRWPVIVTQWMQIVFHRRLFGGDPESGPIDVPAPLALLLRASASLLRRLVGRIVGLGLRPEHVRTAEAPRAV